MVDRSTAAKKSPLSTRENFSCERDRYRLDEKERFGERDRLKEKKEKYFNGSGVARHVCHTGS